MLLNRSCHEERVILFDGSYERLRAGTADTHGSPPVCGDCGAPKGGYHHPGCDMEVCPRCGPGAHVRVRPLLRSEGILLDRRTYVR